MLPLRRGERGKGRSAADAKSKKVGAIGAGRRDWDFSAVFPIAPGAGWGGAIDERSARLEGHRGEDLWTADGTDDSDNGTRARPLSMK